MPALNSYWLAIHVTAMTLASGTFMVGAVLAVVYLFAERHTRRVAAGLSTRYGEVFRLLPSAERLDQIAYRTVVFAFPIWTFGIMAGAIWADEAWGRYWGWDPTETWAFITWVVYACFLHARVTAGWRGRRAAYHPAGRVRLPAVQPAGRQPVHHRPALLRRPELSPGMPGQPGLSRVRGARPAGPGRRQPARVSRRCPVPGRAG